MCCGGLTLAFFMRNIVSVGNIGPVVFCQRLKICFSRQAPKEGTKNKGKKKEETCRGKEKGGRPGVLQCVLQFALQFALQCVEMCCRKSGEDMEHG